MVIGVIGLGAMGAGITQLCLEAGLPTVACDTTQEQCETARTRIEGFMKRKVEKDQLSQEAFERACRSLSTTVSLNAVAEAEVVIEAIVEDLQVKQGLFARLDELCGRATVLATNTSALSVAKIAAATTRPERVVGMHFFNPAPLMPLVEVVRAERSADATVAAAFALGERIGKRPIVCHDTPGFVVNRVFIPLINDTVRVLDEARIDASTLDTAMKHGAGWPLGPCELLDLIGIDVHVHASESLWDALRDPRMAPPPRLVSMSDAGLLGRKSGRGFYDYAA